MESMSKDGDWVKVKNVVEFHSNIACHFFMGT